ncbi:hypothetical protein [Gelidibacter maritimus]|uniref:Lipocalin-like domain-containing protein n=1 Tax=Gelidibacter maritimus TaxID=2761487 RepID=A0A7W2M4N1_9FLAO|nr:hypothetical protein [Gelidibacter maritimus]MBA6152641.1 hypothetical protein [Gelidibacter maritimus]
MKILFLFISLITLSPCNDSKSPDNPIKSEAQEGQATNKDQAMKLNGTWEMVSYYNYVDNEVVDSFKTNAGYKQVKMYTDRKVMWSKNVPGDSTEWFGYGDYTADDNELIEVLEYGSEMMRSIIEEKHEFKYELVLDKNKFSQIEIDDEGNRLYSENYRRIE